MEEKPRDVFRVFWTDANHPEPQMVLLRFYSKERAYSFAQDLAMASAHHTTIWVEKEPAEGAA